MGKFFSVNYKHSFETWWVTVWKTGKYNDIYKSICLTKSAKQRFYTKNLWKKQLGNLKISEKIGVYELIAHKQIKILTLFPRSSEPQILSSKCVLAKKKFFCKMLVDVQVFKTFIFSIEAPQGDFCRLVGLTVEQHVVVFNEHFRLSNEDMSFKELKTDTKSWLEPCNTANFRRCQCLAQKQKIVLYKLHFRYVLLKL